jgi:peptide deformylase
MISTDTNDLKRPNEQATAKEAEEIVRLLESELCASPHPGIGLAAPQIRIHKRVAIIRTANHSIDLVNPKLIDVDHCILVRGEGCLSLPGVFVDTLRFDEVFVKCDWNPAGFVATGLEAIAIQHEIDHLDGILMVNRVKNNVGRNDLCPCGSKVKFKRCHGK